MDGTSKQRKTEQEIIQLMEEFEASDSITVKEFCEMQDISNATFYNWQKIYRNRNQSEDTNGFVSLEVSTSPNEQTEATLFAEVKGIRFYKEVSASFLKELVS
jgi:hypothetical protein